MSNSSLNTLLQDVDPKSIRPMDVAFAQFIQELDESCEALSPAAYLLSQTLGKGNVCLDFNKHPGLSSAQLKDLFIGISKSSIVCVLSESHNMQDNVKLPLVLHGKRLYLQRYWLYEMSLHQSMLEKMKPMPWPEQGQAQIIKTLFPLKNTDTDWQAVAASVAANKQFSVITGGPGTGKTTTVIRLLAILIHQYQTHFKRQPIIKLAAPTGKAAMRLTESINGAKNDLSVSESIKQHIPRQASTLHRLLSRNRRGEFKYNRHNPLHLDVLIVDEASMVDLPLMSKLMSALPLHGQIILLGDKDQLASVEAGSVLADICDSEKQHGYSVQNAALIKSLSGQDLSKADLEPEGALLRDHICQLRKSYRFNDDSGIGFLARAANGGDFVAWKKTAQKGFDDLNLINLTHDAFEQFIKLAGREYRPYLQLIDKAGTSDELASAIYSSFSQFQVLCALREGALGVAGLNESIEQALAQNQLIDVNSQWYMGRPIMIMENDYGLNLYNGDIGIILPQVDVAGVVRAKVAFIGSDGAVRWIQPSRLPKHETVFAMTVHKSQGSEFNHCALVLPDYRASVVTKELIYTGITRAKKQLTLIGRESVIQSGLKSKVQRFSGLRDRLWSQKDSSEQTQIPVEHSDVQPEQISLF